MRRFLKLSIVLAVLLTIGSVSIRAQSQSGFNLIAAAQSEGQLNTFVELAQAADLAEMLSTSNGPFTIVAPTDAAFSALSPELLSNLKSNPGYVRQVILYHTLKGSYYSDDLGTLGVTATGVGKDATFGTANGSVVVNGSARLVIKNINASNGVLHVIDAVLSPEGGIYGGWSSAASGGSASGNAYLPDPSGNPAYLSGDPVPYWAGVTRESMSCKGMTWTVLQQNGNSVRVGADRGTNPYRGDTSCAKSRPVLCFNRTMEGPPSSEYAHGWSHGQVKATDYVTGNQLSSREAADGLCQQNFGAGWRMAEFHEGGMGLYAGDSSGWAFWANGTLPVGQRFWVSIYDQAANPWDSVQPMRQPAFNSSSRVVVDPSQNPSYMGDDRMSEGEMRSQGRPWCKGMTWVVKRQANGLVQVGADKMTNAYVGDRSCPEVMPALCVNVGGFGPPANANGIDYSIGWSGANIKATGPVSGESLSTREAANNLCKNSFGNGWRMAEFHDGSLGTANTDGWEFWGYGDLQTGTRYWVAINDQHANPWNP